jgi:hypothetical protein
MIYATQKANKIVHAYINSFPRRILIKLHKSLEL